jgi:hypothetical protein
MRWRHALADATNFDRGLEPTDAGAVVDLTALRAVTPYGVVAMTCLAGHNDRLLTQTSVLAPADPTVAAELLAAGFDFVVREYLCPVVGGIPLPLAPRNSESGEGSRRPASGDGSGAAARAETRKDPGRGRLDGPLAYGPLARTRRRLPVVEPPLQPLRPVHDPVEMRAVVERCASGLDGSAAPQRIQLVVEALEGLLDNRRRHAHAFDAVVAVALVDDDRRGPRVELAVGDCGIGLRASVAVRASSDQPAPDDADAVDDATAAELALTRPAGTLARLAEQVRAIDGTLTVRSGTARATVCRSGVVRAAVPFLRGTVVALSVPTGVPAVSPPPGRGRALGGSDDGDLAAPDRTEALAPATAGGPEVSSLTPPVRSR